ncbi:MAG: hypothetical protein AAFX99_15985 [Myxococcota bacterium]
MVEKTKFDRVLGDFRVRSAQRIQGLTFTDSDALGAVALALRMLDRSETVHDAAVSSAMSADEAAYTASEALRESESQVEQVYDRLYNALQMRSYGLALDNPDAAAAMRRDMDRAGTALSPSAFRELGVDRTLDTGLAVVTQAKLHLPEDNAQLTAFSVQLGVLSQARDTRDTLEGTVAQAMVNLTQARDQARRFYSSARNFLKGALDIEDRAESIGRLMPPLSAIYNSSPTGPSEDSDPPDPESPPNPTT